MENYPHIEWTTDSQGDTGVTGNAKTEQENSQNSEVDSESHELVNQREPEQEGSEESGHATAELLDDAQTQLEKALEEVALLKDQMLREQAETQNVRRRVQRDVENARKFALEKFVEELLPLVDNLERAIDSAGDDEATKPVLEGIELTYKSFVDVLKKFNVEQINPIGEPFDPQLHEAMTMVPNPNMEPNSVMDVMQKGYTLNGRLVRAARVVVTKSP